MTNTALHVLIIAHPDDESMFFVPTLRALQDETVWILCLTTGDYDGLGKIRSKEMLQAGQLLHAEKVLVCDNLKDHPTKRWDIEEVKTQIHTTLKTALGSTKMSTSISQSLRRLVLITFDQYGVSGHINHIDTYRGVCGTVAQGTLTLSEGLAGTTTNNTTIPVEGWTLASERNIVAKYLPLFSLVLLLLSIFFQFPSLKQSLNSNCLTYRLHEPRLNWKAMATHKSQFVWYRRLFVVFSSYTYVNTLHRIPPADKNAR